MNACHGAGVGAREPGGDAGLKVTAVGGVTPVAQAVVHEPMPEPGDRIGGQASGGGWAGEAEAGQ